MADNKKKKKDTSNLSWEQAGVQALQKDYQDYTKRTNEANKNYRSAQSYKNNATELASLDQRREDLRTSINNNSKYYGKDLTDAYNKAFDDMKNYSGEIAKYESTTQKYFSQFKDAKSYKTAMNENDWNKKYNNFTYSQVNNALKNKNLSKDEYAWLKKRLNTKSVVDTMTDDELFSMSNKFKTNSQKKKEAEKKYNQIYGLLQQAAQRRDTKRIKIAQEQLTALKKEIDSYGGSSNIAYYDDKGNAVTYDDVIADRKGKKATDAINSNPEARKIADEIEKLEAQRDKRMELSIGLTDKMGGAGGIVQGTLNQLSNQFKFISHDEKGYNYQIEAKKKQLADMGYDYDSSKAYTDKIYYEAKSDMIAQNEREFANAHPVISTAAGILTAPFQAYDYVENVANTLNKKPTNIYDDYFTNFGQNTSSQVAENINKAVLDKTNKKTLAWLASSTYSGVTSSLQSAATAGACTLLFGPAGEAISLGLMGMESANSTFQDVVNRGGTNGQALLTSVSAGVAEGLFEKFSLENLGKIKELINSGAWDTRSLSNLLKSIAKNSGRMLLQGFVEGTEEGATDIFNNIADAIIAKFTNGQSGFDAEVAKYMYDGMSEKDAKNQALKDTVGSVLESMYGGLVGGLASSGATYTIGTTKAIGDTLYNQKQYSNAVKQAGADITEFGNVGSLIAQAENLENTKANQKVKQYAEQLKSMDMSTEQGQNEASKLAGKLYAKLQKSYYEAYSDPQQKAVKQTIRTELEKSDFKGNIDNAVNGVYKKITASETQAATLTPAESRAVKNVDVKGIANTVYGTNKAAVAETANTIRDNAVNNIESAQTLTKAAESDVSQSGKTEIKSTGEQVEIAKIKKIENSKSGEPVITLELDNGETVTTDNIAYKNNKQALLYEGIAEMNTSADAANQIISAYSDSTGLTVPQYLTAMELGYRYGVAGQKEGTFDNSGLFGLLSPEQQKIAYNAGRADAIFNAKTEQNRIEKAVKSGKEKGIEREGSVSISKELEDKLTDAQKVSVKTVENIVKTVTKNDVEFFESVEKDGKRVFAKDTAGYKAGTAAPNGWFDTETGKIYLDINAGNEGKGTILWTAAHEFTHFVKEWSPAKFQKLADFLVEQYGEKGVDVQQLVQAQVDKAERNGRKLSYEAALEEVVADSMQQMFTDTDMAQKLNSMRDVDKSLWEKAKEYFNKLFDKIKEFYGRLSPETKEAKLVSEMVDAVDEIRQLFAEGLLDAGEIFSNAEIKENSSDNKFSYGGRNAENADESKLQMAIEMEKNGVESEEIRQKTGWFKSYDGKWRFEINDRNSSFSRNAFGKFDEDKIKYIDIIANKETTKRGSEFMELYNKGVNALVKVSDVYKNASLFKAYPQLKDYKVSFDNLPKSLGGFFDEELKRITLNYSLPDKEMKKIMIHELQHAIQDIEGFTAGTDTSDFLTYLNTAGEIEAYDVGDRVNMTAEQRKNTRPDIDRTDVVFAEGGVSYYYEGKTEDGRSIYHTNYGIGTPKAVKQNDIINLVQKVWSKSPIKLNIIENNQAKEINANFNPELTERSDLSKIAFGNRKGTGSEKRITYNLSSDFYQIASESKYVGSKNETGKLNEAHKGVTKWNYFVTNLVYEEDDGTRIDCYMNIDVKQNGSGDWFYSFAIEKGTAPQTLLAVVTDKDSATVPTDSISTSTENVNSKNKESARDSDGNTLSEQQAEYFKDSKIRDEDGNLLVVYHGTDAEFTVFDRTKGRSTADIQGSFFSPWDIDAGGYGSNLRSFYLNIKNPASESVAYKAYRKFAGQNNAGIKAREYLESLGYDGVNNSDEEYIAFNSNQIKLVDNTAPTENEDIRFSDRDPEAQAQLEKVNRQLERANEKLSEDLKSAKEMIKLQSKVTKGKMLNPESLKNEARRLVKSLNAQGNAVEFSKILNDVYGYIMNGPDVTWESVTERLDTAADWVMNNQKQSKVRDSYADDVLKQIRGTKISLTESQKQEAIKMYGSLENFRKKMFGKVYISESSNNNLDTQWQEWSNAYPNLFGTDTNEGDMVTQLDNVFYTLQNSYADFFYGDTEMQRQQIKEAVYDGFWDVAGLYTVADKNMREITLLKNKHKEQIAELKQSNKDKISELKQAQKDRIAQLREQSKEREAKTVKKYQEAREKNIDSRKKTELRHKIIKRVKELNNLLLKGTKDKHIPIALTDTVRKALESVNMDTVNAEKRIADIDKQIENARSQKVIAELQKRRNTVELQGERMAAKLDALSKAYESIKNSADSVTASAYDENIAEMIRDTADDVGDTPLREMSREQLEKVNDMYKAVLHTVKNANKLFKEDKRMTVTIAGNSVITEVGRVRADKKQTLAAAKVIRQFGWNNLKPVYAFKYLGSETLSKLFDNVRAGEDTWAVDVSEARNFYLEMSKKYGFNKWDLNKSYEFESSTGRKFKLNLQEIMSIYAYSKREQAQNHLSTGGIVFDTAKEEKTKGKLKRNINTADTYKIPLEVQTQILDTLSKEQMEFADEMQKYLSETMGAKGNEVSRAMYDFDIFKEKNYFPLRSAKQYLIEQDTQTKGEARIKNSSFTKEVRKNANNPIVISGFMDVWADHVNQMSMYHAFTLPLEDFMKVYNYQSRATEDIDGKSVKGTIQSTFSPQANEYIRQLITDLNGGVRMDSRAGIFNQMVGKFKKNAVLGSLSVIVQQPSARIRAEAYINEKYFIKSVGKNLNPMHHNHKELWTECKKYAPVAVIKEMGYFDTDMGMQSVDWIKAPEYDKVRDKIASEGFVKTLANGTDDILSFLPGFADEITWTHIWLAVKNEVADKNKGIDVNSEEYLQKCGKRFTEVIVKTQVYDSVLSRSGLMRSKDVISKSATSFMAEPTTTMNMLVDAVIEGKRIGGKKGTAYALKPIIACFVSTIVNAALASIVYTGRDDDKDKAWREKYVGHLTETAFGSLNPLGYLPLFRDVSSMLEGYDVERTDLELFYNVINSYKKLSSDTTSTYRKIEDFGGAISAFLGIPLKNVMRDARGIYNTVITVMNNNQVEKGTYAKAFKSNLPFTDKKSTNKSDKKYDEFGKTAGISKRDFKDYQEKTKDIKGKDLDGDGKADPNSKKNQILDVINSMQLTSEQKDALYYMNGWAESKLNEAPWH